MSDVRDVFLQALEAELRMLAKNNAPLVSERIIEGNAQWMAQELAKRLVTQLAEKVTDADK